MSFLQQVAGDHLNRIQRKLSFEDWKEYPQFADKHGLGRTALLACCLGIIWGVHLVLWLQYSFALATGYTTTLPSQLSQVRFQQVSWQWCAYTVSLCTFHLLEFFTTAVYNPSVASSESFLVNHSIPYTAAFCTSLLEFGIRCLILGWGRNGAWLSPNTTTDLWSWWISAWIGLPMVLVSQTIRSMAMATAGESFNHIIQTYRHSNHRLVTHGIYRYWRHPSYVGFYYWSIGVQLVLGNWMHAAAFAIVSWRFFAIRIPYEEQSLCRHFPEYPDYMKRTWSGIPFMPSFQPRPTTTTTTATKTTTTTKDE